VAQGRGELLEMVIEGVVGGEPQEGYIPLTFATSRGNVQARYYQAPGARLGAVCVGGASGGWDTPARGLYPRLSQDLLASGISSLHVRYRHPVDLDESALDVLAGVDYLQSEGVGAVGTMGHSFGGAVVIQAAVASPAVRTVVTLATQSYGAWPVGELSPRASILLIHGADDQVLDPSSSEHVYSLAHDPKRLVIYPGAGHRLDEVADEVTELVRSWTVGQLGEAPQPPPSTSGR
jgi:pimeloyl-ACP methyl ester carboxylesterase